MRASEVAELYSHDRPGFQLIGFEDVVLPQYRITLEVVVQRKKAIPPIEEFVLRTVSAGIDTVTNIVGFLGLDRHLAEAAITAQWQVDNLDYRALPQDSMRRARLSEKGRLALSELRTLVPERMEISIDFDRMAWRIGPPSSYFLRPREVKDQGVREIPARHGRRPTIEDVPVEAVGRVVREAPRLRSLEADVLAIRDIVRTERIYQPAVMLIYGAKSGTDIEVTFAIDGRISRTHEFALAEMGGPGRLRLTLTPPEDVHLEGIPSEQVAPEEVVDSLRQRVATAKRELEKLKETTRDPTVEEQEVATAEHEIAKELRHAQDELDAIQVRRVQVYEHPTLLEQALTETGRRLLIISPWIVRSVVNDEFCRDLEGLCRRSVRVHIGYGIGDDDRRQSIEAQRQLVELARRFPNLVLRRLSSTHAKILIWDDKLVVTSFNWLSFPGGPRQEEGLLVTILEIVERHYADLVAEIEAGVPPTLPPPRAKA